MVNLTFILFEWGSVQMNPASMSRTLLRPLSFLRQMARSSRDSGSAICHVVGGDRKRSQFLQNEIEACFGIPSVISTLHKVSSLPSGRCDLYARVSATSMLAYDICQWHKLEYLFFQILLTSKTVCTIDAEASSTSRF